MTIVSLDQVTEFPLCWPDGKPRCAKRSISPFRTTLARAHKEIAEEMGRWRAGGYVVSMAPAYRQGPVDPGAAVWWNMPMRAGASRRELRVLACDNYVDREANLHAVALTLTGLRAFERYGTYTLHQAAEGARPMLPPPASDDPPWWEVLGVSRDWPLDAIEMAYRGKIARSHPDTGGSEKETAALTVAIAAARKELRND